MKPSESQGQAIDNQSDQTVGRLSPRSGRQHKARGGAKRNPGNMRLKITDAREAADRRVIMIDVCNLNRYRPLRGLCKIFLVEDPGVSLRSTPGFMLTSAPRTKNQALCCFPLPRSSFDFAAARLFVQSTHALLRRSS